jgi:hypothetical protein
MWIERATVGELSTRPLGANPEPPSTIPPLHNVNVSPAAASTEHAYLNIEAGCNVNFCLIRRRTAGELIV